MVPLHPGAAAALALAAALTAQDRKVDFVAQIQPILRAHCYKCHGEQKQKGDLRLDRRDGVFHGDKDLWVIVPGDADASLVFERLTLPADDEDRMPAEGEPLPAHQIELIRTWIAEGADWPVEDDAVVREAAAKAERDRISIALDDGQRTARDLALERLRSRGALAQRVAADTEAVEVSLRLLGRGIDDGALADLDGLEPCLVWLDLGRTGVTDRGLARVAAFHRLRRLSLAETDVGDAGIEALAQLGDLRYLNLFGTRVTDRSLEQIGRFAALEKVFLWRTEVTADGATALRGALPACAVDRGEAVEALLAAEPPRQPVNSECPVSGKPVDPAVTAEHEGKLVAFCCADCRAKFTADPAKFAAKLAPAPASPAAPAQAPPVQASTVNTVCPVSGKPVDAAVTLLYEGRVVGFCCESCRTKFEKEPARFEVRTTPK
jgi:YHS domain-containing protein